MYFFYAIHLAVGILIYFFLYVYLFEESNSNFINNCTSIYEHMQIIQK